jgi:hypothetical protein
VLCFFFVVVITIEIIMENKDNGDGGGDQSNLNNSSGGDGDGDDNEDDVGGDVIATKEDSPYIPLDGNKYSNSLIKRMYSSMGVLRVLETVPTIELNSLPTCFGGEGTDTQPTDKQVFRTYTEEYKRWVTSGDDRDNRRGRREKGKPEKEEQYYDQPTILYINGSPSQPRIQLHAVLRLFPSGTYINEVVKKTKSTPSPGTIVEAITKRTEVYIVDGKCMGMNLIPPGKKNDQYWFAPALQIGEMHGWVTLNPNFSKEQLINENGNEDDGVSVLMSPTDKKFLCSINMALANVASLRGIDKQNGYYEGTVGCLASFASTLETTWVLFKGNTKIGSLRAAPNHKMYFNCVIPLCVNGTLIKCRNGGV